MTKRSLRLVLATALCLFIPLWAATAAAADIKGALQYVPNDAFAVVGVDGDKLRTSPLYKKAIQIALKEPGAKKDLERLRKATGIDVLKHIRSVVVAFDPNVVNDDDQFLAVIEVPANEAKVLAFMKKEGAKYEAKMGPAGKYYLLGRKKDGAMAFRGKYIILGAKPVFDKAMRKTGPSFKLKTQLNKVSGRTAFVAADVPYKLRQKLAREDKNLGEVQSFAAGADLTMGLKLDAYAKLASAAAASKLSQMANMGLKEARKAPEVKQLGLASLLNGISVSAQGPNLNGKVQISSADLNKLIDTVTKLIGI